MPYFDDDGPEPLEDDLESWELDRIAEDDAYERAEGDFDRDAFEDDPEAYEEGDDAYLEEGDDAYLEDRYGGESLGADF